MIDPVKERKAVPRDRLERWLVRKISGGSLQGLPPYVPMRGVRGQSADGYARELLAQLRGAQNDALLRENLKDDGRAFRSWAERAHHALSVVV